MLVEQPLGNLADGAAECEVDWLDLNWTDCHARALKRQTRGGREIRLLLRLGVVLHHEDILVREPGFIVAVNLLPIEVIVAHPRDAAEAAGIAFELGNLHTSMQFLGDGTIVAPSDGPIEAVFDKLGLPVRIEMRRFEPTSRGTPEFTASTDYKLTRPIR